MHARPLEGCGAAAHAPLTASDSRLPPGPRSKAGVQALLGRMRKMSEVFALLPPDASPALVAAWEAFKAACDAAGE